MKMKFDIEKLSKDLSSIRKERKTTLRKASREMKLPHCTVYRIEKGEHLDVHLKTFVKMCNWTGQSPTNYFKLVK